MPVEYKATSKWLDGRYSRYLMLLMIRCQSFDTIGDQAQYFSKEEKVLRSIGREPQKETSPYHTITKRLF